MTPDNKIFTKKHIVNTLLIIILIVDIVAFGEYRRQTLVSDLDAKLQSEKIEKEGLESRIGNLESEMAVIREINAEAISRSESVLSELGDISDTVGTLDKLSKTDPELLQKYSKSYFLNEHYIPTEVTGINPDFTYANSILKIHVDVYPFLEELLEDAKREGLDIGVVSAYRDFAYQSELKDTYKFTYGSGTANQFSAEQGYSEHQLGTTVDFATKATSTTLNGFNFTPEYVWLTENAHKYGFILSYPPTNVYYQYEPWHWRFVGVDLAKKLNRDGRYFYDFDQREINTYLPNIFD